MFALKAEIEIGRVRFTGVTDLHIDSSWRNLTDTCEITLPRNLPLRGRNVSDFMAVGDPVTVRLGYSNNGQPADLQTEFTGYLADILPQDGQSHALKLMCEDEMWRLKRTSFTGSYLNTTLKKLVEELAKKVPGGIAIGNVVDIPIGDWAISSASVAKVFEQISQDFSVFTYFRYGKLYSGLAYQPGDALVAPVRYHFQKNTASGGSLKFRRKEDVKLKVKATSYFLNGTKLTFETGEADGEQRTLSYFDLSMDELKKRAKADLELLKYDGYSGSFTAFGLPFIRHGWRANLQDGQYPERQGTYLVDRVMTDFGQNGFRRTITLGKRTV